MIKFLLLFVNISLSQIVWDFDFMAFSQDTTTTVYKSDTVINNYREINFVWMKRALNFRLYSNSDFNYILSRDTIVEVLELVSRDTINLIDGNIKHVQIFKQFKEPKIYAFKLVKCFDGNCAVFHNSSFGGDSLYYYINQFQNLVFKGQIENLIFGENPVKISFKPSLVPRGRIKRAGASIIILVDYDREVTGKKYVE